MTVIRSHGAMGRSIVARWWCWFGGRTCMRPAVARHAEDLRLALATVAWSARLGEDGQQDWQRKLVYCSDFVRCINASLWQQDLSNVVCWEVWLKQLTLLGMLPSFARNLHVLVMPHHIILGWRISSSFPCVVAVLDSSLLRIVS